MQRGDRPQHAPAQPAQAAGRSHRVRGGHPVSECTRVEGLLEAETAGALDGAAAAAVREHCEHCESCRNLLALHEELMGLAADLEEPSEQALEAVTTEVLARTARSGAASGRMPWRS